MTVDDQAQRLQALLQPLPSSATLVPPTSRYAGVGTAVSDPDGERPVLYLQRRFVPQPDRLATLGEHVVVAGERTDHVAAAELGDPELFWRLCDGNRAVFPEDLLREPGRRLRVTSPEGIPGSPS
ncbi:LysM domain-containing protein [Geodermatophilus amargosae]|uniref:LysM domain-containing protein n=1 Tax=Geodermatophilus amargosae TaxID=1296565 RepID=UPI0034DE1CA1